MYEYLRDTPWDKSAVFVGGHSKHEDHGSQDVMGHEDNASQISNVQIEPDKRNQSQRANGQLVF